MTNQPWSSGQPQGQPGWRQGQSPNPGPPQPRWQQAPGQTQGFSGPGGQPPRGGSKLPLVIGAIVLLAAIVAVAAFFLTRPGDEPTASGTPTTSATASSPDESTGPTDEPNGGDIREFTFDDAPQDVNGWKAQPVLEGMKGTYYLRDGVASGGRAQIGVRPFSTSLELAASEFTDPHESSDGRVICGESELTGKACYVDTADFGVLSASTADGDVVTLEDIQAIADAIASAHP